MKMKTFNEFLNESKINESNGEQLYVLDISGTGTYSDIRWDIYEAGPDDDYCMEQNDEGDETHVVNTASGLRSFISDYLDDGNEGFCSSASKSIGEMIEYLEDIIEKEGRNK